MKTLRLFVAALLVLASPWALAAVCTPGQNPYSMTAFTITRTAATREAMCAAWPDYGTGTLNGAGNCSIFIPGSGTYGPYVITEVCTAEPTPPDPIFNWSDPAQVLQAIFWTLSVFLFVHGYNSGNRLV